MQNRYIADTGDFGKFGLLKNLSKGGLHLGVNWYLNLNEETHNADGKHIKYPKEFKEVDSELCNQLQSIIISNKRNVKEIEKNKILPPGTLFYSIPIPKDIKGRNKWVEDCLSHLSKSDLIFCDPDNGLEVSSFSKKSAKAVKYAFFDEVEEIFNNGKSLVIYQHATRSGSTLEQAKKRKFQLSKLLKIKADQVKTVHFSRGTSRFCIIIQQPVHKEALEVSLSELTKSPWKEIFKVK